MTDWIPIESANPSKGDMALIIADQAFHADLAAYLFLRCHFLSHSSPRPARYSRRISDSSSGVMRLVRTCLI